MHRNLTTTFYYYVRYAVMYGLLGFFALIAPGKMTGTAIQVLSTRVSQLWSYGGSLCVCFLFAVSSVAIAYRLPAKLLIWYAGHFALLYSFALALDSTLTANNLAAPVIWWIIFANHLSELYAPSDLEKLANRLRRRAAS